MIKNNFNNLNLKISKSEYWDFVLNNEKDSDIILDGSFLYDDKIISLIDISKNECVSGDTLFSRYQYKWNDALNNGLSLKNIGFNGIDNGAFLFDKDSISQDDFIDIVTGSTLNINSGDTRLILNMVSGVTNDFVYPFSFANDVNGKYIKLEGGFYQGFFKSEDVYSVLPSVIEDEMVFEFILKPDLVSTAYEKTLNYKYPDNKGIFFYLGTRSENKFWYDYFKNDKSNYEISKTGQTSPINDFNLNTYNGFDIKSQNIYNIETDNKFLLFNRGANGLTTKTFDKNTVYHVTGITKENLNYYESMNRTQTGYTVSNLNSLTGQTKPYNIMDDVTNNCIAFRIKDDGSVGYRTINKTCTGDTSDYIVNEEYSLSSIIKNNEITFVSVRIVMNEKAVCSNYNRTFKLMFYVNGKLVFVSKELPELILRNLSDINEKQESIPYNISIGGGSQGLCDMVGFSENYETQYLLPIEKYFAGSFIGSIYQFKIYYGKTDYTKIKNNFEYEVKQIFNPDYIIPTIDFFISGDTINYPETHLKRETGNVSTNINANIIVNENNYPLVGYKLYYGYNNQKIQINGLFNISPTGGTIPEYQHYDLDLSVSGLTNIEYYIEVLDTYNNFIGTETSKQITFDNMIFYGNTNIEPNNGYSIRDLQNKLFNLETNSFILETGTDNNIFVIAMPENRDLIMVTDQMAFMLDITHLFNKTQINVPDAGGKLNLYNVYIMENAIPYSRNHNFLITLS